MQALRRMLTGVQNILKSFPNGNNCENSIASAMMLLMVMAISLAMAMALVAQLLSHHSSVGSSGQ